MTSQRKTAPHGYAKAVYIKQQQSHSTELIRRIKLKFVQLASWLSLFPH